MKDRDPRLVPWVGDYLTFGFDHYRVMAVNKNEVVVQHRLGQIKTMTLAEYQGWMKKVDSMTRASGFDMVQK